MLLGSLTSLESCDSTSPSTRPCLTPDKRGQKSGSLTQRGKKGGLRRLKLRMGHDTFHEDTLTRVIWWEGVIRRAYEMTWERILDASVLKKQVLQEAGTPSIRRPVAARGLIEAETQASPAKLSRTGTTLICWAVKSVLYIPAFGKQGRSIRNAAFSRAS